MRELVLDPSPPRPPDPPSRTAPAGATPRPDGHRAIAVLTGVLLLALLSLLVLRHFAAKDERLAAAAAKPSIAVLPFKGSPGDAEDSVIARDVAAELVAELARSADLRVVSDQSSFLFDPAQTPLEDIGRTLRTRYIVDGRVRRMGEQLRIGVELLDSQSGQIVWSASHLADPQTMAAMQQDLVRRIAGTLQSRVSRTEERRALAQPPKSLDVFVLTAHGKTMMQRYNAEGMHEARRLLGQALAIDPGYAPAWAYLGMTDTIDIGLGLTGEWDRRRAGEMLSHVQRAIALRPDLTVAYVALSQAHGLVGDLDAALAAAQECFRLSPNDAGCFYVLGATQLRMGQADAAIRNLGEAMDRNPVPPAYLPAFYGTALWAGRRLDDAVRVTGDCLAKAPDFSRCRQDRIAALVELGRHAEAREEAGRLLALVPTMSARQFGAGFADSAAALRDRRVAAAQAAGVPMGAASAGAPPAK